MCERKWAGIGQRRRGDRIAQRALLNYPPVVTREKDLEKGGRSRTRAKEKNCLRNLWGEGTTGVRVGGARPKANVKGEIVFSQIVYVIRQRGSLLLREINDSFVWSVGYPYVAYYVEQRGLSLRNEYSWESSREFLCCNVSVCNVSVWLLLRNSWTVKCVTNCCNTLDPKHNDANNNAIF